MIFLGLILWYQPFFTRILSGWDRLYFVYKYYRFLSLTWELFCGSIANKQCFISVIGVQENDNERRYFMKERMQRFMAGRYGNDQLNQFIFIVAIISMVLEIITRQSLFYTLTLVLLILAYVRVFSRNINKRYEENMKFLQKKDMILNKFCKQKYYAAQRRNFHIYTCPQCKQKIRIPKGKGKIRITCPKCRTSFIKKS